MGVYGEARLVVFGTQEHSQRRIMVPRSIVRSETPHIWSIRGIVGHFFFFSLKKRGIFENAPFHQKWGSKQKSALVWRTLGRSFFVLACDASSVVIHIAHFKFCGHTSGPKMGIQVSHEINRTVNEGKDEKIP